MGQLNALAICPRKPLAAKFHIPCPFREVRRAEFSCAAKAVCMAQCPCCTFREVSCAAKAAFRVRRHGETRRGRRRFHGGRGNASKPAVESPTPIADRRFSMPPDSWSRVAQLHPQNSLKSQLKKTTDLSCLKRNDYDIIINMERESFQITFQGHGTRPPGTSRRGDYAEAAND